MRRRRFFRSALAGAIVTAAGWDRLGGQEPLAGGGAQGSLRDPSIAGRPRAPTARGDSDAPIKRIEQQLKCTCGCNLDIFTCRTTDFTCTYSPELHKEVVALYDDGKTAQQIIDAFVAKYGEKTLMAPKPEGFNLWGYLLPGVAITLGSVLLAFVIGRRERRHSLALVAAGRSADAPAQDRAATGADTATPAELDQLRQALSEVDD
jgi:cytochrome c-type biogenesis protein CcmH/NrfF